MSKTKARITKQDDGGVIVRLRNVRLSFPALFTPRAFSEDQEKKYSAAFIFPKKNDVEKNLVFVKQAIDHVVKTKFKGKHPGRDKICLRDGADKEDVDGYGEDVAFVTASNKKAVAVVDRDLSPLTAEDTKPYAGCRVNATVRLWPQDNKYGKRVNAQLRAVQFLKDDEPFGDPGADPEEEFDYEDPDAGETDDDSGDPDDDDLM